LIKVLHKDLKVKIDVEGEEVIISSTIGVKQGDNLAPVLFICYMQACVEVLREKWEGASIWFRTKYDGVLTGRRWNTKRGAEDFEFDTTLYADDGAFIFATREDLMAGANCVFDVFGKFGLKCHVGTGNKKSKTEAMFFPSCTAEHLKADTSDFIMGNGIVHFTEQFKYLGTVLDITLSDEADVDARIKAAGAAFGALQKSVFGTKNVPLKSKRAAFESIVLGILLHGSESWVLTMKLKARLDSFYNRCIRRMCGLNRWMTWNFKISQRNLEKRIGVRPLQETIRTHQLRWAGHVMRMDELRLPRKFITSWVENPRRNGRPQQNYGHTLAKQLKSAGIPIVNWHLKSMDRDDWRSLIDPRHSERLC